MEQGTRDKGQGKRQKGQGKRDKGNGTRLALAAILCSLFVIAGSAQGQQPPRPDPRSNEEIVIKQPPDGFVPASSLPSQEQLPAAPLVIGAYAVAWVVVFGYLWSIWKRIGRVEQELADVSRRLAAGERR
jgi:CcmD family protein